MFICLKESNSCPAQTLLVPDLEDQWPLVFGQLGRAEVCNAVAASCCYPVATDQLHSQELPTTYCYKRGQASSPNLSYARPCFGISWNVDGCILTNKIYVPFIRQWKSRLLKSPSNLGRPMRMLNLCRGDEDCRSGSH